MESHLTPKQLEEKLADYHRNEAAMQKTLQNAKHAQAQLSQLKAGIETQSEQWANSVREFDSVVQEHIVQVVKPQVEACPAMRQI